MARETTSEKDLEQMGLNTAERKLWRALEADEECSFENDPEEDRILRGDILGKMLRRDPINGVDPLTLPRQVRIKHATISGVLDMSDTSTNLVFIMQHCQFEMELDFAHSHFALLNFEHSTFEAGAFFEDLIVSSHLWLDHIKSTSTVSLQRAKIGGQFTSEGANFYNPNGNAIDAQRAFIQAGVFLRGAYINGCAFFNGTQVDGQFDAIGCHFFNPRGLVLGLQDATIKDSTWLINFPHTAVGGIHFVNATLGHLLIDKNSYPLGRMILDGTAYRNIHDRSRPNKIAQSEGWLKPRSDINRGEICHEPLKKYLADLDENKGLTDTELTEKTVVEIERLSRQDKNHTRHPFAYQQFAKVLHDNGHEREARDILVEAGDAYTERIAQTFNPVRAGLYRFWRWLLRHLIAYGIKPWRIIPFMLVWWAIGTGVFWFGYDDMTPSRERFYLTYAQYEPDGRTVKSYDKITPKSHILPNGYPDFSPVIYALDVMLPVVDFAQESHWRPKNVDGPVNCLRWFNRIFLALGWAFSTIAVLGFTGLISDKRKD